MAGKGITIYDIARESGVSASTVSRVITGNVPVRADKAERVRKAMEAMGYRPNLLARNLQTRESKTIGVILPDITNPFFAEFYLELERAAMGKGFVIFLCNTMNNAFSELGDAESIYLRTLVERRVDGIIFLGGRINDVRPTREAAEEMEEVAAHVPLVMVNGRIPGMESPVVRTDERAGFISVLEHLIGLGHRKIALLGGLPGMVPADLKIRAFRNVMKKSGLTIREDWIRTEGWSVDAGEAMIERLLASEEPPTAVACANDFVALGVLRAAMSEGLNVPEDLSVAGFDGVSMSAHSFPALTTASHDFANLAGKALDVLLNLKDGRTPPRQTVLPMTLVQRESSGPPRD